MNGNGKRDEKGDWIYKRKNSDRLYHRRRRSLGKNREDGESRVDSDHFPVVIEIKERGFGEEAKKEDSKKRKRWIWSEQRKKKFRYRIEKIGGEGEEEERQWKQIRERIQIILEKGQKRKKRKIRKGWWDEI